MKTAYDKKNSRKQCSVRSQATTLIYKNFEADQVVDCKWKHKDFGNFVKLNCGSKGFSYQDTQLDRT
ncbi:unnamed protein product [Brassica oleracea]|uniref:Uncharacterized protein n=3 Tax=Brassica TaxID=3705 RepID=A0A0D3DL04_BRAOL|nr:unnamed protein product [Brassica napus]VDC90718.1 unnamed protein product [Brassica oleracea]